MRKILTTTAVLSLLLVPAIAQAAPGGSANDEYTEHVPGAGGDTPSEGVGGGSGGGGSLPPGTAEALAAQGTAGERAAALAQATAPNKPGKGSNSTSGSSETGEADQTSGGSGGGVGGVIDQIASGNDSEEGGMGPVLPIVLGATVLGACALLLARRRGSSEPPEQAA